jgi:two-component system CheB/CheR fusion protein
VGAKEQLTGRLAGLDVLLVDDHEDILDAFAASLEREGAAVTGVTTVDGAVDRFRQRRYDVVVSDLNLPGKDGFALIRDIRALGPERGGDVCAVAHSATYAGNFLEPLAKGFNYCAVKSNPGELIALLQRIRAHIQS